MLDEVSTDDTYTVPATLLSAGKQHSAIGRLLAKIKLLTAKYNSAIGKLQKQRDEKIEQLSARALGLARGEEVFVEEHKAKLFGNKSIFNLPQGGSIEEKNSPLRLDYAVSEEEAVALLEKHGLEDCINYHPTVSKTRLKELFDADPSWIRKLKVFRVENGLVRRFRFLACTTQIKRNLNDPESSLTIHEPRMDGKKQIETAS